MRAASTWSRETRARVGEPATDRIGTPRQLRWLRGIVQTVLVLNLLDAIFTIAWVGLGVAREANPFLQVLASEHPVLFVLVKTTLVGLASVLLWRLRTRPIAVVGIFAAFLIYYALLVYHLAYLSWVAGPLLAG